MSEMIFQRKFISRKNEFKAFIVVEIPIQPFLGMRIKLKDFEYKITEIIFDVTNKDIIIRTDSHVDHVNDIIKMKEMASDAGWTIEGEKKEEDDCEDSSDGKLGTVGKKKKKKKSEDDDSEKVTVPSDEDEEEDEKKEDD